MLITIENFGPIRRVEFDLSKDLSVIFGKNNIGKSYAITAVYLLLKVLRNRFMNGLSNHSYRFYFLNSPSYHEETANLYLKTALTIRNAFVQHPTQREADITTLLEDLLRYELVATAESLGEVFSNSFPPLAQLTHRAAHQPLAITLHTTQATLVYQLTDGPDPRLTLAAVRLAHPAVVRIIKTNRQSTINDQNTVLYLKAPAKPDKTKRLNVGPEDFEAISNLVWNSLSRIGQHLYQTTGDLFYLPASRSGLYQALSAFGAVVAELSKSRQFVKNPLTLPSISEPVSDYFLDLSNLDTQFGSGAIHDLGREMEQQILGGEIGFNQQTKKLSFTQATSDQALDLAFTSSMVSEIAPIVAFLKYIVAEAQTPVPEDDGRHPSPPPRPTLLFIEEPEAHLHPEVQVKLLEFFARLTKHNVKVVMTTHSNYMFNKLSNLLLTGQIAPANVGSYLMVNTPEGSIVAPDAMTAEAEGIADENFADIAEKLYNERLQAYDAQADAQAAQ